MATCKSCGALIMWIIMAESGKNMPVDNDKKIFITKDGKTLSGYIPHWITCKDSKLFKGEKPRVDDNTA